MLKMLMTIPTMLVMAVVSISIFGSACIDGDDDSEGIFSKIAQAVGYDDIDFESHEFSRKYCVRSKDKKFAYDVCNARMIDYLLDNLDLTMEIEGPALAIGFKSRLSVDQIRGQYGRLLQIRSLIPNYLFE